MPSTCKLLRFLVVSLLVANLPALSSAQDATSQIQAEISRLQQSLKDQPISDPHLATVASSISSDLASAAKDLDSGRLYLSLEKLLQAEDLLWGARTNAERAEAVKSGYPAFEAEWNTVSQRLTDTNRATREKNWANSPAVVRALSETALGRSVPLLDGGRGFALSTQPSDGLFYLGQAEGEAAFARFASALTITSNASAFPLRSFLPELIKLQEKTNAAFRPPRSVQLHDRFIVLNSALKLAEELDAQKFYAGALYQYLEAARHFGMLDAPPVNAARQPALKAAIAEASKKFAASKRDDSMAQLFLQRAATQIAHADGSASSPDEFRSAQVILDLLIPAYLAASKPAAPIQQATAKTVQLTLVRWPYT
jgi:hypothetical protein